MMAKRILVVEDERDHRELLELIFHLHGYEVETAENAQEAMDMLQARRPDAIVLDVMLPDADGWELCEVVKHHDLSSTVPVMMLSASAHMLPRFEGSCADDMLSKPFDEKELMSKVRHLLGDDASPNQLTK